MRAVKHALARAKSAREALVGPRSHARIADLAWAAAFLEGECCTHIAKQRRPGGRSDTCQTRHTAATLWLASGEAPEWIARQLGHTSTEMLFRTYSRYVPNLTRQDGSAFERLLASRFSSGATNSAGAAPARPQAANEATNPEAQPPPVVSGALPLQRAA